MAESPLVSVLVYELRIHLLKANRTFAIISYGDNRHATTSRAKVADASWNDFMFALSLQESELQSGELKIEVMKKTSVGTVARYADPVFVPLKRLAQCHCRPPRDAYSLDPIEQHIYKNNRAKGFISLSTEATGWRHMTQLLSDESHRVNALRQLQILSQRSGSEIARIGDSKLASYLKKPLLDKLLEIVASISRSPSSSSRSKLVEPDPELVSSMKGALKGLCGDRHSRPILIDLELLSTFNNIIKSKGVATCWRIHVMDCMKSFFGSARYQRILMESGVFASLLDLITSSDLSLSVAAFDVLRYFDVKYIPTMMEVGILDKLAKVANRDSPSAQQSVVSTIHFFGKAFRVNIIEHTTLISRLKELLDSGEPQVRVRIVDLYQKFDIPLPDKANVSPNNVPINMLLSVIESETAPVRRLRAFERLEDELLRSPENHVEWSVDSDIARTLVLFGYGYPSSLVQKKAADISKLLAITPQRLFAVGLLDLYKAALENPRNTPEYLFDILMYMRDNYDLIVDALSEQQFWRTLVSILYNNAFVESTKRVAIELLIRFGDEVFLGIANDAEMFSRITNVLKSANPWPPERIPFTCSLLHVYGRILTLCSNENQAIKRREEVIAAIAKCTRSAILTLKGDFESAEAQEIINPWIVKSLAFVLQFKYLLNEKGVAPDLIVLLHKIFIPGIKAELAEAFVDAGGAVSLCRTLTALENQKSVLSAFAVMEKLSPHLSGTQLTMAVQQEIASPDFYLPILNALKYHGSLYGVAASACTVLGHASVSWSAETADDLVRDGLMEQISQLLKSYPTSVPIIIGTIQITAALVKLSDVSIEKLNDLDILEDIESNVLAAQPLEEDTHVKIAISLCQLASNLSRTREGAKAFALSGLLSQLSELPAMDTWVVQLMSALEALTLQRRYTAVDFTNGFGRFVVFNDPSRPDLEAALKLFELITRQFDETTPSKYSLPPWALWSLDPFPAIAKHVPEYDPHLQLIAMRVLKNFTKGPSFVVIDRLSVENIIAFVDAEYFRAKTTEESEADSAIQESSDSDEAHEERSSAGLLKKKQFMRVTSANSSPTSKKAQSGRKKGKRIRKAATLNGPLRASSSAKDEPQEVVQTQQEPSNPVALQHPDQLPAKRSSKALTQSDQRVLRMLHSLLAMPLAEDATAIEDAPAISVLVYEKENMKEYQGLKARQRARRKEFGKFQVKEIDDGSENGSESPPESPREIKVTKVSKKEKLDASPSPDDWSDSVPISLKDESPPNQSPSDEPPIVQPINVPVDITEAIQLDPEDDDDNDSIVDHGDLPAKPAKVAEYYALDPTIPLDEPIAESALKMLWNLFKPPSPWLVNNPKMAIESSIYLSTRIVALTTRIKNKRISALVAAVAASLLDILVYIQRDTDTYQFDNLKIEGFGICTMERAVAAFVQRALADKGPIDNLILKSAVAAVAVSSGVRQKVQLSKVVELELDQFERCLDRPSVLFDITSSLATIFSSGHKFSVETVRRMLDLFKLAADAHKDTKRLTARIVYFSANVARKSMRCKKMVNERLTETTVKLGVRNLQKKYDVDAMALVAYFRMIPMLDYENPTSRKEFLRSLPKLWSLGKSFQHNIMILSVMESGMIALMRRCPWVVGGLDWLALWKDQHEFFTGDAIGLTNPFNVFAYAASKSELAADSLFETLEDSDTWKQWTQENAAVVNTRLKLLLAMTPYPGLRKRLLKLKGGVRDVLSCPADSQHWCASSYYVLMAMYGEGLEAGSPVLVDRSIYHGNGPPPFISCPPHQASRLLRAPSGVKTLKEPGENRFLDMTDGILITPKSPILQVTGIRPQFSSVLINAEVSCISLESYFALTVAHYSLRGNFFRMGFCTESAFGLIKKSVGLGVGDVKGSWAVDFSIDSMWAEGRLMRMSNPGLPLVSESTTINCVIDPASKTIQFNCPSLLSHPLPNLLLENVDFSEPLYPCVTVWDFMIVEFPQNESGYVSSALCMLKF